MKTGAHDRRRLRGDEIDILRSLAERSQLSRVPVTLRVRQREQLVPLWRWELVDVFFRQAPASSGLPRGPFFALTAAGLHIARHMMERRP